MTTSETPAAHGNRKELIKRGVPQYVEAIAPRLRQIHKAAAAFGVFVLDSSGHVVSWNALARQASGYRAEEILGRNLACLYPNDEAADGRLARALAIAAATGRFEDQASLVSKGGVSFWAEIVVTAVRDATGNLCGFACMIRDLSEPKRGQVELASARAAALESSRLKSAFLANISHEFRTPLNIILGYSDLIGEHLAEVRDTSQKVCLEAVARACKRLLRTLNAVLDYSKLDSRSFLVNPRTVALIPLIRKLIDELEPQASQKGLRLAFEFGDNALSVPIDEYCLTHSLRNLLENAIKFTERGSPTIRLYREASGAVCLSVTDTGIGIERAFFPHLLEPFSQEDSGMTRRFEGAGLGLALTRRYLELNGASLTVRSEKGLGSTFTIHFAGADKGACERASPKSTEPLQPDRQPMILVVEDDLGNQILMRAMMNNRYQVMAAASPAEARRQIESYTGTIDLILMDLGQRSAEDGLMLTRSLRSRERFRTTPIVALTGHATIVDRERALAAGCDDFVVKPFERTRLFEAIERLLPRALDTGNGEVRKLS